MDPALERLNFLPKLSDPKPLDRSIADHHRDGGGARERLLDVFNDRVLVK
jgi:hypothetical protein